MARFVQIVEFTTSRIDEVKALNETYRQEAAGNGSAPESVRFCANRDVEGGYVTIAEFSSYERAMANNSAPATQHFAEHMMKLCDGPPTFRNLDLLEAFSPA